MQIEIITSELDFYVIEKVRELRIKATPYIDQVTLAQKLGVSEGYIGSIENPKLRSKYNIRMLHRIANALNLPSYTELLPDKLLSHDLVKIRIDLKSSFSRKHEIDKNGEVIKRFEVLAINPLSKEELELWNNKSDKLKYLSIIAL